MPSSYPCFSWSLSSATQWLHPTLLYTGLLHLRMLLPACPVSRIFQDKLILHLRLIPDVAVWEVPQMVHSPSQPVSFRCLFLLSEISLCTWETRLLSHFTLPPVPPSSHQHCERRDRLIFSATLWRSYCPEAISNNRHCLFAFGILWAPKAGGYFCKLHDRI